MKKEKNKKRIDNNINTTEYGEFVCSLDHWLPIEKQKEQADRLEKITKKKK